MRSEMAKRWIYFLGAVIVSFTLVWFGVTFLSISDETFSKTGLLLFGLFTITAGICLISLTDLKKSWVGGLLVTAVGFYGCARATGVIEQPWLARIVGAACLVAALVVLYIARPTSKHSARDSHDTTPTAK